MDNSKKNSESRIREAEEIFMGKQEFHMRQAALPMEEKMRILRQLQKIVIDIQGDRGWRRVWPEN